MNNQIKTSRIFVLYYRILKKIKISKMLRKLKWLAFASLLLLYQTSQTQTAECSDDDHCKVGSYCDLDASLCRKCLDCETLKRKPPHTQQACIRSIVECGACIEGLVEDVGSDTSAECVPGARASPTSYVWLAVTMGLLLVALVVVAVVAVRNLRTVKIRASASASLQQGPQQHVASAPECPPPYAPHPAEPLNPAMPFYPESDSYYPQEDAMHPFISVDSKVPMPGAVESDGNQAALPYGYPNYVRPPSYDVEAGKSRTHRDPTPPSERGADGAGYSADTSDSNGNVISLSNPSSVVPSGSENISAVGVGGSRALTTHRWHPQFQDTNNNTGGGGSGYCDGAAPPPTAAPAPAPSLVINVVQSINTLQQQNDVRL